MPIDVYAISLGCPKNRVDTERLMAGVDARPVQTIADAEVVLVNTCAFIEPAVEESLATILDVSEEMAKADPRPLLAVAGCLPGRYGNGLAEELSEVDVWLPFAEREGWPHKIYAALGRERTCAGASRLISTGPGYAYLKVHEGCSRGCSFCTIPSIRGPEVSRSIEALAEEARELTDAGVSEIVMVAQDVTAYGRDLGLKNGLAELVGRLAGTPDLHRLRLMYLYPRGLTDELLRFLAGVGEPLVPYFDVPLQHAHPEILKAMGRPFATDPRRVVDRIRKFFPEAALRTSLITGFPGETDERFQALADFVADVRFDHLGVFAFCPEEGTRAAELPDRPGTDEAEARKARIMELQADISAEKLEDRVGGEELVLVDGPHEEWPGLFVGRTWFQAPEVDGVTYISGPEVAPGKMVRAEITEAKTYDLVALS